MSENSETILDIVQKMERDDDNGNTVISKYVTFHLRETINTIDAYLNSKHTTGLYDSRGKEKPFFNIVKAAKNIWYRATDIDRKHIRFRATKEKHYVIALVANILLQRFMKKSGFGLFLNNWGDALAKYGSAIVKFVETAKDLFCDVVSWNRMLVDPIDFDNNPQIEILWLTPAQLRKEKNYDQAKVEELITELTTRETKDGQKQDEKAGYIKLYEVHGELPLSHITENEADQSTFVQQMHVVTYCGDGKDRKDFTLYRGREAKPTHKISHLIKEDGRVLGMGAVEGLFDAQWMVNHTAKSMKDQLDIVSKVIFQTSDGNFVGQNVLDDIENGDIFTHKPDQPLTQVNNNSHDITSLQNFGNQWKALANEISNVSESMLGANPPSGTAWRQTEALLQESHSLFEQMAENKALYLEEMIREYVVPFLKKQMDTTEEIAEILDQQSINQLDSRYVPNKAVKIVNDEYKERILNGEEVDPDQMQQEILGVQNGIKKDLAQLGNQRFIKPSDIDEKSWKEALEDFEWEMDIDIGSENKDLQGIMSTLNTVFQTMTQFAIKGVALPPSMKMIFNKILELTGAISPVELNLEDPQPATQPAQMLSAPTPTPAPIPAPVA